MAEFQIDLEDIKFNLFDRLKVHESADGFDKSDLVEIISQYTHHVGSEQFPIRQECDHDGVSLNKKTGQVETTPKLKEAHRKFCESGWNRLGLPESIEGIPVPESVYTTCNTILCGAHVAYSMFPELTLAALRVILKVGSDEQKQIYINKMVEGRWGGTMCLTESGAGSDVGALTTTATPVNDGDGKTYYKIKGIKCFITSGDNDLYENIVHLVLARTPDGEPGTKGISLFIVPKFKIKSDGSVDRSNDVVCTKIEEKMGIHSSPTCELAFGQNGECQGFLLGQKFEGMKNMFLMMNEARLFVALHGVGPSSIAYQLSKKYAEERVQFGTEIINHPDVKRMLLKMRCMSRGMLALCQHLAHLIDLDKKEKGRHHDEIALLIPIAKSYCSDEGHQLLIDAIQIHGGYGFCSEYGIEQYARDAKIASIYEGTNGIQSIDLVLRKLAKDKTKAYQAYTQKLRSVIKQGRDLSMEELNEGVDYLEKTLTDCDQLVHYLLELLAKKPNDVLSKTYDFLNFFGNIVIATELLESAILASQSIANANNPETKKYLASEITDFAVFFDHYLTRNEGLKWRINARRPINQLEL